MIIREEGMVVGKLDDASMVLTDVSSDKLAALVKDWQDNGIVLTVAQEEPLEEGQASGDAGRHIPFTAENVYIYRLQLQIAGFEVQTA